MLWQVTSSLVAQKNKFMKPKHPPQINELTEDIQKVYDVLNNESDLACVLIGTSYLSELLGSLVMSQLKKSNVTKNLLKPDRGAIGSFRARADLAYCLDLISKYDYNDLLMIADIRNGFAHKHLSLDFNNAKVQEACGKLTAYHVLRPVLEESNINNNRECTF